MANFFNPDYDSQKIPKSIIINAGEWYYRSSKLFAIGAVIALIILISIIGVAIGTYYAEPWFGEGSLIHTIFYYVMSLLILIGLITIIYGHSYAVSRKSVIKKYLVNQIGLVQRTQKLVMSEKFKENRDYWNTIDLSLKKKMIVTEFQQLDTNDQDRLQDLFLDILNLKKITLIDLPKELLPTFSGRIDSHLKNFHDRILYLQSLLKFLN